MEQKLSNREQTYSILHFIEENKLLTVSQCAKLFYKHVNNPKLQSSRKLTSLFNKKILKRQTSCYDKSYCYYIDKKPTFHQKLLIDLYAELVFLGCNIDSFETSPIYHTKTNKKVIPDALVLFEYNNIYRGLFIEVDFSHTPNLERYDLLYDNPKVREEFGGSFPAIIRMTEQNKKDILDNNRFNVVYVRHDLSNLKAKVLQS